MGDVSLFECSRSDTGVLCTGSSGSFYSPEFYSVNSHCLAGDFYSSSYDLPSNCEGK